MHVTPEMLEEMEETLPARAHGVNADIGGCFSAAGPYRETLFLQQPAKAFCIERDRMAISDPV